MICGIAVIAATAMAEDTDTPNATLLSRAADAQDHVTTPMTSFPENVSMYTDGGYHGNASGDVRINPEARLLQKLLRNYDNNAKPVPESGGPINVFIGYYLGRISNLVRTWLFSFSIITFYFNNYTKKHPQTGLAHPQNKTPQVNVFKHPSHGDGAVHGKSRTHCPHSPITNGTGQCTS